MEKEIIDLSNFGNIWDEYEYGHLIFESNLCDVFDYLEENNLLNNKKQKYKFCVSKLKFKNNSPERYSVSREGTILKLNNFWKVIFGKTFSVDQIEDYREKESHKWENWEKQVQRRSSWGVYSALVRSSNENIKYNNIQKLPAEEREKELQKLKGITNFLVIG